INAGRHYDSLLVIEGLLLLAAMFLMQNNSLIGHYLASCACGIQNALATRYSGAIVRTTHVTGIFTDLGIMLGARVRGETIDNRKMILFMLIILGFISGGAAGAMLFNHYGFIAFSAPIAICFTLALSYRLLVKNKH
ncbi:MAG: DUF1275 domain-containing protein, partial [Paraglaciecola sp.]|nr:DUF1275 domain-containing protein [Paraglaciecola sp.]